MNECWCCPHVEASSGENKRILSGVHHNVELRLFTLSHTAND